MTTKDFPVFDADSHVVEPPALWEKYLDPEYRERGKHALWRKEGRRLSQGQRRDPPRQRQPQPAASRSGGRAWIGMRSVPSTPKSNNGRARPRWLPVAASILNPAQPFLGGATAIAAAGPSPASGTAAQRRACVKSREERTDNATRSTLAMILSVSRFIPVKRQSRFLSERISTPSRRSVDALPSSTSPPPV